ncbi:uncharacterized protein LTR77_010861 [Saxophila tyrrhenica]|uniref:Uncharacterized protein n=1 Tax=Saxophila tyrrhenica TaxID=1690608 RepID=A0AAV9NXU3_9PEZI|nr:hypothetical protein LTR77_010861 [Saxophila tyrrhenica]
MANTVDAPQQRIHGVQPDFKQHNVNTTTLADGNRSPLDDDERSRWWPELDTKSVQTQNDDDVYSTGQDTINSSSAAARTPKSPWVVTTLAVSTRGGSPASTGSRERDHPWKPSLLRIGPMSGLCVMLVAVGSMLASLAILLGSNHAAVTSWKAPPSTYLAICTAVANLEIRYACVQGVAIAWWSRALRGTTLARLHYDWRAGTTVVGAMASGRRMGLLGLACICSVLVVANAPLLQRATTVVPESLIGTVPLNVTISPEIPTGYTGWWNRDWGRWDQAFNDTIPTATGHASNKLYAQLSAHFQYQLGSKWLSDGPLRDFIHGCDGVCRAKVKAPALSPVACSSRTLKSNYSLPMSQRMAKATTNGPAVDLGHRQLIIGPSLLIDDEHETLNLFTGHATMDGCEGTFKYRACTFASAVGEYDVTIDNNRVTLDQTPPRIVSFANNAAMNHTLDSGMYQSTLAGIVTLLRTQWTTSYATYGEVNTGPTSMSHGTSYMQFMRADPVSACGVSFDDPYDTVVQSLNSLMFLTGMVAGREDPSFLRHALDPGLEVNTTTTGYRQGEHNVYRIDFVFFFAAVMVDLVCMAFILPTYWGWWRIGRSASFSPLELAEAFNAPLLAGSGANSSGSRITTTLGDVPVQYYPPVQDLGGRPGFAVG